MTVTALYSEHVLAVPDLQAATHWWCEAMGFELVFSIPGWAFLRLGGCRLRLGECPDAIAPAALGDHQCFAFIHVDDVDGFAERLARHGAIIRKPPTSEPWGLREMAVQTPEGHRVMLGQDI